MDIFDSIRCWQELRPELPIPTKPPEHRPEILYIGCIDARLDPINDIGIPKGKALIFRNIAALVRKANGPMMGKVNEDDVFATGEIPESTSMGAALEFFINHLPPPEDGIKHIVVSGHTNCGGIRACLHGATKPVDKYLPTYLSALKDVRSDVLARHAGHSEEDQLHALEQASVRQSVENLMSYEVVKRAVEEGRVQLHGWVIDTATQKIQEMDSQGRFLPMTGGPERAGMSK